VALDRDGSYKEGTAFRAILRDEVTSMGLEDALGDRQTKTCSTGLTVPGAFCPVERSEDMRHILGVDAWSRIRHGEVQRLVRPPPADSDLSALWRVAQGVVQEVIHGAGEELRIGDQGT
jgi:hypothetical protein